MSEKDNATFAVEERTRMRFNWWFILVFFCACVGGSLYLTGFPSSSPQLLKIALSSAMVMAYGMSALFLFVSVLRWWGNVRFTKLPALKVSLTVLRITAKRNGVHSFVLSLALVFVIGASLLTVGFAKDHSILTCAGTSLMTWVVTFVLWFAAPPAVLFLSSSQPDSITLLAKLDRRLPVPLYTGSLIDGSRAYSVESKRILGYHSFRTTDPGWQHTVATLVHIAPIVILDTRFQSPAVTEEARLIADAGLSHKAIGILGVNGESPVLNLPVKGRLRQHGLFVTESDVAQRLALQVEQHRRPGDSI